MRTFKVGDRVKTPYGTGYVLSINKKIWMRVSGLTKFGDFLISQCEKV